MGAIASQITSLTTVYSTVYSGADQRKHQSSLAFVREITESPAQRASSAENVAIWWHNHVSVHLKNAGVNKMSNNVIVYKHLNYFYFWLNVCCWYRVNSQQVFTIFFIMKVPLDVFCNQIKAMAASQTYE